MLNALQRRGLHIEHIFGEFISICFEFFLFILGISVEFILTASWKILIFKIVFRPVQRFAKKRFVHRKDF